MADRKQPSRPARPGTRGDRDPGYTPGPDYVDPETGVESANDLTGGGTGGDIDLPDITGRGTTRDLTQHGSPDEAPGGSSEQKP